MNGKTSATAAGPAPRPLPGWTASFAGATALIAAAIAAAQSAFPGGMFAKTAGSRDSADE